MKYLLIYRDYSGASIWAFESNKDRDELLEEWNSCTKNLNDGYFYFMEHKFSQYYADKRFDLVTLEEYWSQFTPGKR